MEVYDKIYIPLDQRFKGGSSETFWIFTDGSIDNMHCDAVVVSFHCIDPYYPIVFRGLHWLAL